jgi:3-methyladenine DNA glycosylase Mpg
MKIRISNNALRYRLTRPEVERFAKEGVISETTPIGDDKLTYILQRAAMDKLTVTFKNNMIALSVPEHLADDWTSTERVGISNKDECGELYLLIEKDFKCLDNVEEDQSDNYENPLAGKR